MDEGNVSSVLWMPVLVRLIIELANLLIKAQKLWAYESRGLLMIVQRAVEIKIKKV